MDEIRHSGVVTGIEPDRVLVTIVSRPACAACHARGACVASDMQEKEIEISNCSKMYAIGQQVTILMRESTGIKALVLGYLLPFLLLVGTLVVSMAVSGNEMISGFIALAILIPYYAGLYMFRDKLRKTFRFELEE